MSASTSRLQVVDALRGFAIASIMLLHNIEHFDFYFFPPGLPGWLAALDGAIWDSLFFLFGGKSYAIFALLFGLTFFLQFDARAQRGEDFRPRFAWRMFLLLGFGLFNSMIFEGDILSFYAVLGLALLPVARLRDATVLAIAGVLLLQPWAWYQLIAALPAPAAKLADPPSWAYFARATAYLGGGSATAAWLGNLTNGKMGVILWSWEVGRIFQIPALFMLGMLAGRRGWFVSAARWGRVLPWAALAFAACWLALHALPPWGTMDGARRPLDSILTSWSNLAFMLVLVSSFVLAWHTALGTRLLSWFAPMGRMSLSCYVMQSVAGAALYYGYGLGLYQVTGASASLLIGIALAVLQAGFCRWWLARHRQGPLEAIWHRLTWLSPSAEKNRASGSRPRGTVQ